MSRFSKSERLGAMALAAFTVAVVGSGLVLERCEAKRDADCVETIAIFRADSLGRASLANDSTNGRMTESVSEKPGSRKRERKEKDRKEREKMEKEGKKKSRNPVAPPPAVPLDVPVKRVN